MKSWNRIPETLEQVIKTGETIMDNRLLFLQVAEEFGWPAVKTFQSEDLARDKKKEKKLTLMRKELLVRKAKLYNAKKKPAGMLKNYMRELRLRKGNYLFPKPKGATRIDAGRCLS